MSLTSSTTRADFFSGRYCLSADVATGERRLIDALRDATRNYVDVRHVRVTSLDGQDPAVEYAEGLLSKAEIEWVAVRAEPPRAEARLYGFVKKAPVRVALVLRTCRVEGTVHLESGSGDPLAFFLRGADKISERFMAVTGATVTPSPGGADESVGLAIVNRSAVRLYSVLR